MGLGSPYILSKAVRIIPILVFSLLLLQGISLSQTSPLATSLDVPKQPLLIRQGPMSTTNQASDPVFWFQQGAVGDSQTANTIGANVTIRTVYDRLNQDAHSYWVGSLLANNAFVQVGYLNGLSTTGQSYCCAWFYEYFPPGNTNSPPFIGREGSAGPIGSWHSYSMISVGNGVWDFYMDNVKLGSSPSPGSPLYLGSNAVDTGSQHFPAGIAEVAQTASDKDILGPTEFKNLVFETSVTSWQQVPTGKWLIGYGATSSQSLPDPYSVVQVEGTQDDFLAGSFIPKPHTTVNPDPCANSDPKVLWPPSPSTCPANTSFNFVDKDGGQITPSWISLQDASNLQAFYTSYTNQKVPNPISGNWNVTQVFWHAVNVASTFFLNSSVSSFTVPTRVFSIQIAVIGLLYSLPVSNATVVAYLPDSTSQIVRTDVNGNGLLTQLPPSNYLLHIAVPNGISSNTNRLLDAPGTVTTRVFSLPEVVTIVVLPVIGIIIAVTVIRKREAERRALLPPIGTPVSGLTNCRTCGQSLLSGASFCSNCGTPVGILAP